MHTIETYKKHHSNIAKFFLLFYIFTLPLSGVAIAENLSLSFIAASFYFLSKILGKAIAKERTKLSIHIFILLIILIYLISLDTLIHNNSISNRYYIAFFFNLLIGSLILSDIIVDAKIRHQAITTFIGSVLVIIFLERINIGRQISSSERITMLGSNENELALYVLIAATYMLLWATKEERLFLKIFIFISALAALNLLIDTGSRFAVVALLVIYGFYILMLRLKETKIQLPTLILVSSLVLATYKILNSHMLQVRFAPFLIPPDPNITIISNISDLGGRVELWICAWTAFLEQPLLGMGFEGYREFMIIALGRFQLPHNFFLELAALGGIGALALLMASVLVILKQIASAPTKFRTIEMLIWSCPLLVAVTMLNIVPIKAVWFLYVFVIALGTRTAQSQSSNSNHSFQQE